YLTFALVAGILVDRWTCPAPLTVTALFVMATAASISLLVLKKEAGATITLLASFAVCGVMLAAVERTADKGSRLGSLYESTIISPDDPVELTGILSTPPEPAPQGCYLDVAVESIGVRDEVIATSGRVWLMNTQLNEDEFKAVGLDYGSRIRVLIRLERARAFSNPGSPDFNEFLERRGYDL